MLVVRHGKVYAMVFDRQRSAWVYIPEKKFFRMDPEELKKYDW